MQKIGEEQKCKFKVSYLRKLAAKIEGAKIYNLVTKSKVRETFELFKPNKACVLVISNYSRAMAKLDKDMDAPKAKALYKELIRLKWDTKGLMKGKVKNKLARHNLCFADFQQKPRYDKGRGRVYNFSKLPLLQQTRESIKKLVKMDSLVAEGNLYYDVTKCGIGYHGDTERNVAIGLRLGAPINLYFRYYHKSVAVSKRVKIQLKAGDLYIMSKEAVGKDWRKTSKLTLRHAAGCEKYTA